MKENKMAGNKVDKESQDYQFGVVLTKLESLENKFDDFSANFKDYMTVNRADMVKHCEESDKKYVTKIEFAPYQKGINWLLTFIAIGSLSYLGAVSLDIYKTYIKQKSKEEAKLVDNRQA